LNFSYDSLGESGRLEEAPPCASAGTTVDLLIGATEVSGAEEEMRRDPPLYRCIKDAFK